MSHTADQIKGHYIVTTDTDSVSPTPNEQTVMQPIHKFARELFVELITEALIQTNIYFYFNKYSNKHFIYEDYKFN